MRVVESRPELWQDMYDISQGYKGLLGLGAGFDCTLGSRGIWVELACAFGRAVHISRFGACKMTQHLLYAPCIVREPPAFQFSAGNKGARYAQC